MKLVFIFFYFFSYLSLANLQGRHGLANKKPEILKKSGIDVKLGKNIAKTVPVRNHEGKKTSFEKLLSNGKPSIFSIVYYRCPSLCNLHLNGLMKALEKLDLQAGKDFNLITLSMDHKENYLLAAKKRKSYLEKHNLKDFKNIHFLTASKKQIKKITDSVGFNFQWEPKIQEYAHSSAAIILSPKGKISKYLMGIRFDVKTLKLSLVEAGKGSIGSMMDQFLLYCFRFNPETSRYSLYAYRVVKAGGALMLFMLLFFLSPLWFKEWKKRKEVNV